MCPDGITPSASKRCKQCGEVKPATTEFFAPEKRGIHGVKAVCRECKKLYFRAYNAAHKEVKNAQNREWRAAHRDEQIIKARERYAADPSKSHAQSARWRAVPGNADVARAHTANWRAKQLGLTGEIAAKDIRAAFRRQEGKCLYCGCSVGSAYHIDHMTALARGGQNTPDNIAISCPGCNLRKRTKTAHEFTNGKSGLSS